MELTAGDDRKTSEQSKHSMAIMGVCSVGGRLCLHPHCGCDRVSQSNSCRCRSLLGLFVPASTPHCVGSSFLAAGIRVFSVMFLWR